MAGGISMILLDTCAFLWLVSDYHKLSSPALEAIEKSSQLLISPISALEITLKYKAGKLLLPDSSVLSWYNESIRYWELTEHKLESDILVNSALLPTIHKDPFDRIIVATALSCGAAIITADEVIPKYPKVNVIW
jgi:PIN domain nuclease of toxin-antitoxin system